MLFLSLIKISITSLNSQSPDSVLLQPACSDLSLYSTSTAGTLPDCSDTVPPRSFLGPSDSSLLAHYIPLCQQVACRNSGHMEYGVIDGRCHPCAVGLRIYKKVTIKKKSVRLTLQWPLYLFLPQSSSLQILQWIPFVKDYKLQDVTNPFLPRLTLARVLSHSNKKSKTTVNDICADSVPLGWVFAATPTHFCCKGYVFHTNFLLHFFMFHKMMIQYTFLGDDKAAMQKLKATSLKYLLYCEDKKAQNSTFFKWIGEFLQQMNSMKWHM